VAAAEFTHPRTLKRQIRRARCVAVLVRVAAFSWTPANRPNLVRVRLMGLVQDHQASL